MANFTRSFIALFVVGFLIFSTYLYKDEIIEFIDNSLSPQEEIIIDEANQSARGYTFEKYQMTTDFEPENYEDLLNIFYTILNSGWKEFFFYCPDNYPKCVNDVSSIISDNNPLLSSINNYVSPYNSYKIIETTIDSYNKVTISPKYNYSDEMINTINQRLTAIEQSQLTSNMTTKDKIRAIHDYIINTVKYDSAMVNTGVNKYNANLAYGPLINGYAICGGYSDAMALFLDRMGVVNYKVASANHVWNYVLLDNKWYHLDLTWDDPISSSGQNRLIYSYFLISEEQLNKLNTSGNHTYDHNLY